MIPGWNEFAFFDATPIQDPLPGQLYSDPDVLDIQPSSESVFMATRSGTVKEFSGELELLKEFTVCGLGQTPNFVRPVKNTKLLLTAFSELGKPHELLVWNLETPEVQVHSRVSVSEDTNTSPITQLEITSDLSVIALGFANGTVIVVRGDLLHDRGTRQRAVYKAPTGVSGLVLSATGDELFVASVSQVAVCSTTTSKMTRVLDKAKGADLGCAVRATTEQLLVARDSDVALFNTHHRGPSFELECPKTHAYFTTNGRYLVLVAVFETSRSLLATSTKRLLVVDLKHHIVAYNGLLSANVKAIFEQWGRLNVIQSDGVLLALTERPLHQRVNQLTMQHRYKVAVQLAESENATKLALELHQSFADFLFEKQDVEGALAEYIKAIDLKQSSRAIRQFKDSQHAAWLLRYLEALNASGNANSPQHQTLQIICYAKLGKIPELKKFLKTAVTQDGFDFEQAVAVLTEPGTNEFGELAVFVAEQWPDPDLAVQIRLRQLGDAQGTLDYIQTTSVADALRLLIQNSRVLLNKLPVETTGVLITVFTGKFVSREGQISKEEVATYAETPILQSYQAFIKFLGSGNYLGSHIVSAATLESEVREPSYLPPRPRLIFPSFIGHDNEFVIFLEACLQSAPNFHSSSKDLSDIATTLFEMYLKAGLHDRAKQLLDTHSETLYASTVLVVAETRGFALTPEHLVALGLSNADVLRHLCQAEDFESSLKLVREASNDKELVLQAVQLLTRSAGAVEYLRSVNGGLTELLELAVQSGASPVQLVSDLGRSPLLTVGDIQPFVTSVLTEQQRQAERHRKLANSYEAEVLKKREELEKGRGPLIVNYNECAQCKLPTELPAVHFGCRHSYHRQCLSKDECPVCRAETESVVSLRNESIEAAQDEHFLTELGSKKDKMRVVMDFISRGGLS